MRLGVPQIDLLLEGSSRLVVRNDPATGALPFVLQAVTEALQEGQTVVYLAIDRAPARVRKYLGERAKDLVVIDGHAHRMAAPPDGAYVLRDPGDADELVSVLHQAAQDHPGALLAIDSLSSIFMQWGHAGPSHAKRWTAACHAFSQVVAVHTEWDESGHAAPLFEAFDAEARLRAVANRIVTNQYLHVARSAKGPGGDPLMVKTDGPTGIVVYIPKLLVTGPFDAGKTHFVHAVSDRAVSAERQGTTVAMDRGHYIADGLEAEVFGTPGQERFDPLLETLNRQAVGVVLVVDSTAPETFTRASQILQKVWRRDLPVVIAANKQDLPEALSVDEILARITLPAAIPIVSCSTQDKESARAVVSILVRRILEGPE